MYGGGGNAGAVYKNDFVELHNRGSSPISVVGWSVQYGATVNTTWAATAITATGPALGVIPAGGYFLIQEAAGSGGTTSLPTPDATGTINLSGTNGKVALVSSTGALSGACPALGGNVIDMVGYGASTSTNACANSAATTSNTTSVQRNNPGCADTSTPASSPTTPNDFADFTVATSTRATAATQPTRARRTLVVAARRRA